VSTSEGLEGALVTGTSQQGRSRIYWVRDGEKLWVLNPEVFAERGWKFEDVLTLPDAELEAIPTSERVVGQHLQYVPRDNARKRVSWPFLSGVGIEIGAGVHPQALPEGARAELFELRSPAEVARLFGTDEASVPAFRSLEAIPERFRDGADFLIAHNVLEHCADPIATLLEWTSYLRDGGTLVLSVPCAEFCPDKGRLVPGLEHLILDFLLSRDASSFESREHSYSCTMGWMNTWEDWLPLDKNEVAARAHEKAHMRDLEVHWHAFTPALFDRLLQAASRFGPRPLHPMAWADPYQESASATVGDIIGVLRVGGRARAGDVGYRTPEIEETLAQVESSLARALDRIRGG
jgi:SAM-dependent methyltransferase